MLDFLRQLIHRLLADRHHVAAYLFDGYWLDIGRHSDYQKALDDYESIKPFLAPALRSRREGSAWVSRRPFRARPEVDAVAESFGPAG